MILGTILGDACLERNGRNVRLRIDHSVRQRAFVEWKFIELGELNPSTPRIVRRRDKRTGQIHENYRFTTQTTAALNEYYGMFHPNGSSKCVPRSIIESLTSPLSLAVWYMDDGGRRSDCRSGYLNTNAYTVEEVNTLQTALKETFDISTSVHFAAGKPRIYIPQRSFKAFCDVVRPHVIDEMRYKLL